MGIALADQLVTNAGNFTVFPGAHTSVNWGHYPDMKKNGELPGLGEPTQICLLAGEAIFAHVLLPHRGGRNVYNHGMQRESYERAVPWGTREMVFFRVKARGIDYSSPERSLRVLHDPWAEYQLALPSRFVDCRSDVDEQKVSSVSQPLAV